MRNVINLLLFQGPISENNAASVVDQITDLVSDPRWLNSSDVDELTTLLEKALTLSTSQAVPHVLLSMV